MDQVTNQNQFSLTVTSDVRRGMQIFGDAIVRNLNYAIVPRGEAEIVYVEGWICVLNVKQRDITSFPKYGQAPVMRIVANNKSPELQIRHYAWRCHFCLHFLGLQAPYLREPIVVGT